MGNVTLKKIAELSDVSIRTVSRALKNHPGVKPETGQRVLELAERLGYTPNIAARNLRLNHSNVVGIIMSSNYSNNVAIRKVNDLQKQLEEITKQIEATENDWEEASLTLEDLSD